MTCDKTFSFRKKSYLICAFKSGIIKQDPELPPDKLLKLPPPRPKNAVFEDEEKSKVGVEGLLVVGGLNPSFILLLRDLWCFFCQMLSRLLNSSHPEDLKAANKLIKEMVQEVCSPTFPSSSQCFQHLETRSLEVSCLCLLWNGAPRFLSREARLLVCQSGLVSSPQWMKEMDQRAQNRLMIGNVSVYQPPSSKACRLDPDSPGLRMPVKDGCHVLRFPV